MFDNSTGRIVLIGGEKGGPGKTTIAVNLAVARALDGHDVLLVDTDLQGSASDWISARDGSGVLPRIASVQKFGKGLARELEDLVDRYGDIIVDAGGRDSVELRAAMTKADIMVAPIQASSFDLWTLRRLDELVRQAQGFNEKLRVIILISRASTNTFISDTRDAEDLVSEYENFSLAYHPIRERISFRRSVGQGMGIIEYRPIDKKAIKEINSLYKEIYT